jgi:hypothetical protein
MFFLYYIYNTLRAHVLQQGTTQQRAIFEQAVD